MAALGSAVGVNGSSPNTIQATVTINGELDKDLMRKQIAKTQQRTGGVYGACSIGCFDMVPGQVVCSIKGRHLTKKTATDILVVPTPVGLGEVGWTKEQLTELIDMVFVTRGRVSQEAGYDGQIALLMGGSFTIGIYTGEKKVKRSQWVRVVILPGDKIPCPMPSWETAGKVPFTLEPIDFETDMATVGSAYQALFPPDARAERFHEIHKTHQYFARAITDMIGAVATVSFAVAARQGAIEFTDAKFQGKSLDDQIKLMGKNLIPTLFEGLTDAETIPADDGKSSSKTLCEEIVQSVFAVDTQFDLFKATGRTSGAVPGLQNYPDNTTEKIMSAQKNALVAFTANVMRMYYDIMRTTIGCAQHDCEPGQPLDLLMGRKM